MRKPEKSTHGAAKTNFKAHQRDQPKPTKDKKTQKQEVVLDSIENDESCLLVSNIASNVKNQDVINLFKKYGKCSV